MTHNNTYEGEASKAVNTKPRNKNNNKLSNNNKKLYMVPVNQSIIIYKGTPNFYFECKGREKYPNSSKRKANRK
jgi:hypothetical protein